MTDRPLPPARLLAAVAAADYCGVTPRRFRALVRSHVLPPAVPGFRPERWDREKLDRWLDQRSGIAGDGDRALEDKARAALTRRYGLAEAGS